jgi:hypothetical protein
MDIPRVELQIWYVVGALAAIEIALIARYVQLRYTGLIYAGAAEMTCESTGTSKIIKSLGREGVQMEVERLRAGGDVDNDLINNFSQEDRILFEVAIIDALTKWSIEEQTRLRRVLVKSGFDERCSRRLLRGDLSGHVRASTILGLLRPQ